MHQLITLEAVVVANVMTDAAVTGPGAGALTRCFPPTPSIIMNVITFGIHAALSYLTCQIIGNLSKSGPEIKTNHCHIPMNDPVAAKRHLVPHES